MCSSDNKSMIVLVDTAGRIPSYVQDVPDIAFDMIELATSPLTVIFEGAKNLAPNVVNADDQSVGIRVATDDFCPTLIGRFRKPIVSTSANIRQLSPNPQKLAGMCGKLKCCLNFEYEAYVEALKAFSDPNIVLHFESGDAVHQKNDVFKGIMWYSYTTDKSNIMAIPVDKVKEIIAQNKKGQKPAKLEDYAVTQEAHTNTNEGYGEADLKKMSD